MSPTATAPVVKVVELVGISDESWSDAARSAVSTASETIRNITGVDVIRSTATVRNGMIHEYHVDLKVAFVVDGNGSAAD